MDFLNDYFPTVLSMVTLINQEEKEKQREKEFQSMPGAELEEKFYAEKKQEK